MAVMGLRWLIVNPPLSCLLNLRGASIAPLVILHSDSPVGDKRFNGRRSHGPKGQRWEGRGAMGPSLAHTQEVVK